MPHPLTTNFRQKFIIDEADVNTMTYFVSMAGLDSEEGKEIPAYCVTTGEALMIQTPASSFILRLLASLIQYRV
jgi:hypothetical protein